MLVNADFSRRAIVTPDQYHWIASPQAGVERVMLDRVGEEKARATSIVRYAPDSHFPGHEHPGGEEILVLSGVFSEGQDNYPAGWYMRNPPGSSHRPFSIEGAVIFVKLRQMREVESRSVRVNTREPSSWHRHGNRDICPLFSDGVEQVALERLMPAEAVFPDPVSSAELLVLDGGLTDGQQAYEQGSWIRLPAGAYPEFAAGAAGATFYLKTGQLNGLVD